MKSKLEIAVAAQAVLEHFDVKKAESWERFPSTFKVLAQGKLEALREALAAIQAQPDAAVGWVSVTERLPEDDCAVLVASWFYITGEQRVESAHYSQGLRAFDKHSVTHWQPLPPPPVQAQGSDAA